MNFKNILFSLLLVTLLGLRNSLGESVIQDKIDCPDDWIQLHRGCYKFIKTKKRWADAETDCLQMNGDLISLQSLKEKKSIEEHVKTLKGKPDWWVHLKKQDSKWTWGVGDPVNEEITPWKSTNIRNRGDHDCGSIEYKGQLILSNAMCGRRRKGYICEHHDSRADQSTTKTTTTSQTTIESVEENEDELDNPTTTERRQTTSEETTASTKRPKKNPRPTKPVSKRPHHPRPTRPAQKPRPPGQPNMAHWLEALEEFDGCFIPGRKGTVRQMVLSARRIYKNDVDYCPPVTISRLHFPETIAGETAVVKCKSGSGSATLECGEDTVCWQDEPDLSACASPRFKSLFNRIKKEQLESVFVSPNMTVEERIQNSVNVTSELLAMTETEDDLSMEDILVTSKVLASFSHHRGHKRRKTKDKKSAKRIVENVIKTGNNLLSKKKTKMWRRMRREEKVRSSTSLLVAMETATLSIAETIEEPAVIKQVEENLEMEIQVVNVNKLEKGNKKEIVYDSHQSASHFSIPLENLNNSPDGGLDTIVFITHYSMAELLDERNDNDQLDDIDRSGEIKPTSSDIIDGSDNSTSDQETHTEDDEENNSIQIASYILSASIASTGDNGGHNLKLKRPITFSMKHTVNIKTTYTVLCSFLDISQGESQAFWSQQGCGVKSTNRSYTTCECDHMTSFAILVDVHGIEFSEVHQSALRLVTIVGCVISSICLIIAWLTFQFCTALQGERNSIHKNLAFCLFVAEVLFVAGVSQTEHKLTCSILAVFMHYVFLSAFTWMFLEGLHIIIMVVQVFDASRSRLPHYYVTGYVLPAVVVIISCAVYFPGYGTDEFCWLNTDHYFIWSFAGPVALILLINAIFLAYAMTTVCRHSDYVFNAKDGGSGSPIGSWIQGALALEVLLGLTWTFGYFLLNENTVALAYTFTVLNSLQGLFIFIFHCLLNKKVQKEYSRVLRASLMRSTTSASTQSTFGKRTSKSHDLGHSNSRKQSLNYKQQNGYRKNSNPCTTNGGTFGSSLNRLGSDVNKNQTSGIGMQSYQMNGINGYGVNSDYIGSKTGKDAINV